MPSLIHNLVVKFSQLKYPKGGACKTISGLLNGDQITTSWI